jgi:hypothetical protein
MPARTRCAAPLALGAVALALAGCGSARKPAPMELQLERADLVAVAQTLIRQQPTVGREVAATKVAWPLVAHGLPANIQPIAQPALSDATGRAAALTLPAMLTEHAARSLTGPASTLAGIFRAFVTLASRGWQLVGAAVQQTQHGPPAAARFARANVALYIDSVYDAHFSLAQIGKQIPVVYQRLGGPRAFGAALTLAQVRALANFYSEPNDRLYPHPSVRLGS